MTHPTRLALTAALALGALALPAVPPLPVHPPTGQWCHRLPITLSNPNSVALRDFQARLTLDATNFDFALARADGGDLRFADADGWRYLPHWVEHYEAEAQRAVVWVKVPELPAGGRRTIYLYFGNPLAEDLSGGGRTFEMFDDFGRPGLGYYTFGPPTTVLTRSEAWESEAPHTLSVVELNRAGYRYWGYYGLADCGGIGLARSNDLQRWEKAGPLLRGDGERWPSVLQVGQRLYMAYDRDHCGTSHVVMRTSEDGLTFSSRYTVLVAQEAGIRNQNPALFRDPNDGMFYLYWFRGGQQAGRWQIKARRAWRVEGLADPASERVLIDVPYELAAPHMIFLDGTYFLATEVNENAWKTKIYAGPTPLGPFIPLPDAPQLSDNQACLFQHVFDGVLHGYLCKDTGAGWVLNHRSADLRAGRSRGRQLDPGVWTAKSGRWQLVTLEDGQVVLEAGNAGLLTTALQGRDYAFQVRGRLLDARGGWGIILRAQGERDGYRVALRRIADGRAEVGATADDQVLGMTIVEADPRNWLRLGAAIQGDRLRVTLDDREVLAVSDPQGRFAAGHGGLWADGRAWFDDVLWHKVAERPLQVAFDARQDGPPQPH
jgi:hypothetical protein